MWWSFSKYSFQKSKTDRRSPTDAPSVFRKDANTADLYEPVVPNSNPQSKSSTKKSTTSSKEYQTRSTCFDHTSEQTLGLIDFDIGLKALLEILTIYGFARKCLCR